MKNTVHLTFLAFIALLSGFKGVAQTAPTVKNVALLINGKQYSNNAAIPKSELAKLTTSFPQVINLKTKKVFTPVSFEWVVSVADSNAVWKGHCPGQKQAIICTTGYCKKRAFADLLDLMKPDDLLFIDDIRFKTDAKAMPVQFSLKPY